VRGNTGEPDTHSVWEVIESQSYGLRSGVGWRTEMSTHLQPHIQSLPMSLSSGVIHFFLCPQRAFCVHLGECSPLPRTNLFLCCLPSKWQGIWADLHFPNNNHVTLIKAPTSLSPLFPHP
jgi:hypothetical protein